MFINTFFKTNQSLFTATILCLIAIFITACGGGNTGSASATKGGNTVTIHHLGEIEGLNPVATSDANATYVELNIFAQLLNTDFKTLKPRPWLAVARPEIKEINDGEYKNGMSLTYEIRPEATWDDGSPVLASDYLFTIKAVKNPKTSCASLRPYLEFINDIVIDPQNPKKFTVFSKQRYILAEEFSSGYVLPEKIYDPSGIMKNYTIKQLDDPKSKQTLENDHKINEFATAFTSPKFMREDGVVGCGPYKKVEWETGQYLILERKKDWWGDKVPNDAVYAHPERIVYKPIPDWTTAVTALKGHELDVAISIRPNDFLELKNNETFKQHFQIQEPNELSYVYLSMNRKKPQLADAKVRKALAHLVDKKEIIDNLMKGMAQPVTGPISPFKDYYDKSIPDVPFDVEKAKALLAEAGWKDSDGNGIADKIVNGEKVEMKLEFKYNNGNDTRKSIGILMKENAKRAGIEIEVVGREWTLYLEDIKRRDYMIACQGWIQGPSLDDLKQIWHTESDSPDGNNHVGFGNAESDKIIEEIRVTLDETKRNELYKKIQQLIAADQPYIFIYSPKGRNVVHKRFTNAEPSMNRPGYDEKGFKLATATQ